MGRRRPGRYAARREEAARRQERAAAPPPHPPHYGDVERRLAEEVRYLHSLWRSGPPAPAALHPGGGSLATHVRADRRKRRRLERMAEPEDPGYEWPLAPSPPASPSPASWPSSSPTRRPPPPQPSPAWLAQRTALRAAEEFFSGHASDDDEGSGSEDEEENAGEAAAGFFVGLFERDAELRGYYERSHEEGEFLCMGCAGRKARRGRARRFRDCIGLVLHARAATRCGRRRAHRALAAAVCRVLGWDIQRLPSIVIDPRGTLGQSLAAATSHQAKENVGTSLATENDNENAAKEDVGSGKNSSSSDKEEDVDSGMNDALSSDGVAAKEDVDTMKSGPSSNGHDGVVHEQENVIESAEKEDTNNVDPLSSKDPPMELCKSVQEEDVSLGKNSSLSDKEEDVDSGMNDALLSDGVAAKEDVDTMKSSPSSNGNDGEVLEQENVIESAEKEERNDRDALSSKDTPMELCKSVQEEQGAIDNKQEHAKSADDMEGTCNASLENNSPKEEAARENKEEHTNYVAAEDDDIGNLGTGLMGSSKS